MPKVRTTVTLDEEVMRWVRVRAAREGRGDSQVIEDALRRHLGLELLDRLWSTNTMEEDEALRIARDALRASRSSRRR